MSKKILSYVIGGLILVAALGLGVIWKQPTSEGGSISEVTDVNKQKGQAILVQAADVDPVLKDPKTFVIDVHTPEQTHIPGTDVFIPFNEISRADDQLPVDKDTPILVYCRSGSMSSMASEDLIRMGYTKVYDLEGGVNAYKESYAEVVLTPATQDLGTVIYGQVAQAEFTLTNYTSAALKIGKVSTSCSCTQAKIEEGVLGPYQAAIVKVTFDPAVHKDDTDLGDLTRTIFIETDNQEFPRVEADITARVVKK